MRQAGTFGRLLFVAVLALASTGCEAGGNRDATARQPTPPSMVQWLESTESPALKSALTAYENKDYETAFTEFLPLAGAGDPVAQYGLGLMYGRGLAVEEDNAEAVRLFRLSAEQGHPAGQNALGVSYVRGESVEKDYGEAVKWFRLAADQGYAKGQYNLGRRFWNGQGVVQDRVEALRLIRLAADQNFSAAQSFLGAVYAIGEDVPQDYAEAVRWYRLAADQGYRKAQYYLGRKYWYGQGVEQDRVEGLRLIRLAAEQGYAKAQNHMGAAYGWGDVVSQDFVEAVRWYRLSADQGHAAAQYNLGIRYRLGEGVAQDHEEAARLYRLAADQGDEDAQISLGYMYDEGLGVEQDHVEATRLYKLAADQGNADGQFNLGVNYAGGEGVTQDYAEAARWYRLATDQGSVKAQVNLGVLYSDGLGVRQDDAEAMRLYRLAAGQGSATGQYNLALNYSDGRGVEQDYVIAARWYRLAGNQGYEDALNNLGFLYQAGDGLPRDYVAAHALYALASRRNDEVSVENRDDLAAHMSAEQIAEAKRLAAAWRPVAEVEQSADFTQGLLWRVESPEGAVSHVFGTMHSSHPVVASPPLAVRLVLDTADSLSLETVEDEEGSNRMWQMMLLPEGERLVDITGQDMFDRLAPILEPYGISSDQLQRLKPWAVRTILMRSPDDTSRRSSKELSKLVLDDVLERRARDNGIATFGLETVDEHIALLSEGDEDHHLKMLQGLISFRNPSLAWLARRRQYLTGDLAGLYFPLLHATDFSSVEMAKDFIERVLRKRNYVMVDRMMERIEVGNALVAVGALHLHGEEGIPALLAKRGYKVSRVY